MRIACMKKPFTHIILIPQLFKARPIQKRPIDTLKLTSVQVRISLSLCVSVHHNTAKHGTSCCCFLKNISEKGLLPLSVITALVPYHFTGLIGRMTENQKTHIFLLKPYYEASFKMQTRASEDQKGSISLEFPRQMVLGSYSTDRKSFRIFLFVLQPIIPLKFSFLRRTTPGLSLFSPPPNSS